MNLPDYVVTFEPTHRWANGVYEVAITPRIQEVTRDLLLDMLHAIDIERGYIAPFDTDHVHTVERDTPPVAK